jgi:hypothetical protein
MVDCLNKFDSYGWNCLLLSGWGMATTAIHLLILYSKAESLFAKQPISWFWPEERYSRLKRGLKIDPVKFKNQNCLCHSGLRLVIGSSPYGKNTSGSFFHPYNHNKTPG